MGGGIAFPSICQARRVSVGNGKPHGKPCAIRQFPGREEPEAVPCLAEEAMPPLMGRAKGFGGGTIGPHHRRQGAVGDHNAGIAFPGP